MSGPNELNHDPETTWAQRRSRVLEGTETALRRRARVLAERQLEEIEPDVFAEVVTVRRGDLLLAFPVENAREVRKVEMTGFPGSTNIVNGVFQIRGRVLSLVDLAPFASETKALEHGEETLVIVVDDHERAMGVRIDEVIGPQTIATDEVDDEFHRTALPFVRTVTRDLVHVVDIAALQETNEIKLSQRRN